MKTPNTTCAQCSTPIYINQWKLHNYKNLFCCLSCKHLFQSRTREPNMACAACSIPIYRTACQLKRAKTQYCSLQCRRTDHQRAVFSRFIASCVADVPKDSCWIWCRSKDSSGYGMISVAGNNMRAHRVSWELHYGPIPTGMLVLHRCDVRACVNPAHLFLGTHQDNADDASHKGRLHGIKGMSNALSILTDDQVRDIRSMHARKTHSYAILSRTYGVSKVTIGNIVTRKTWKHIT